MIQQRNIERLSSCEAIALVTTLIDLYKNIVKQNDISNKNIIIIMSYRFVYRI